MFEQSSKLGERQKEKVAKKARKEAEEANKEVIIDKMWVDGNLYQALWEFLSTQDWVWELKCKQKMDEATLNKFQTRVDELSKELDLGEEVPKVAKKRADHAKGQLTKAAAQAIRDKEATMAKAKV